MWDVSLIEHKLHELNGNTRVHIHTRTHTLDQHPRNTHACMNTAHNHSHTHTHIHTHTCRYRESGSSATIWCSSCSMTARGEQTNHQQRNPQVCLCFLRWRVCVCVARVRVCALLLSLFCFFLFFFFFSFFFFNVFLVGQLCACARVLSLSLSLYGCVCVCVFCMCVVCVVCVHTGGVRVYLCAFDTSTQTVQVTNAITQHRGQATGA